ncbi:monovalent cation/H+ antiporter complex subunit F [Yinghuangia soli]|uniref:Uncharacterized protein n=1 Tax=Yinghuangia soli TaxID=2908204 RepID=A0AA41Q0I9_9ACTN|nr:hypothetical protein [Yinghuangia soli]MCF2527817.1 hypothetical protein [Yinghuangia soli]
MTTTSLAALATAVVGLSACGWAFVHGQRQNRMLACVLASIIVCLALVFFSIGQGRLAALDAALVIGTLGPLVTVLVAVRGRGLGAAKQPVGHGRRRHAR